MREDNRLEQLISWVARIAWVGVLVVGGTAIDTALADHPDIVQSVARYAAFAAWVAGVLALAIPAVISLTASRIVVPLAVPISVLTAMSGAGRDDAAFFIAVSVVVALLVASADVGRRFVQASAYGEEDRHLLRPPAAYLIAAALTWMIWAASVIAAPLLLAHQRWILGGVVATVAIAVSVLGWKRVHRLSERWFVVVPIGVVVHDPVVLAETLMLRRHELAHLRLAPVGTEAADLTGPASGHAVEIGTTESTTAIMAATPKKPTGTAIHLTACLIAPTRPGQALSAARARKLPVG